LFGSSPPCMISVLVWIEYPPCNRFFWRTRERIVHTASSLLATARSLKLVIVFVTRSDLGSRPPSPTLLLISRPWLSVGTQALSLPLPR
jgi:hypothetical protein